MEVNKVLLDTNSYSFIASGNRDIYNLLKKAETIYMSTVVLGELFAGFEGGSKRNQNIQILDSFLQDDNVETIGISCKTAEIYGRLLFKLNKGGTPLPTNDIWIAAQTIEVKALLITFDKHFLKIPRLRIWRNL